MKKTISALLAALFIAVPAGAQEMSQKQQLFSVDIQIQPNSLSGLRRISGKVPVAVITDASGRIVAIQVGDDNPTQMTMENTRGEVWRMPIYTVVVRPDLGAKTRFQLVANTPLKANKEVFYLDTTKLDPSRGGTIHLRFADSLIMDTSNKVELKVQRKGARWVASVVEHAAPMYSGDINSVNQRPEVSERSIAAIRIEANALGTGLREPKFQALDPNEIIKSLTVQALRDPRIIETHEANTKRLIQDYENGVESKDGDGLSLRLRVLSGDAR